MEIKRRDKLSYDPEHVDRASKHDKREKADRLNTSDHIKLERDYQSGKITKGEYDKRYGKLSKNWKTKESFLVDESAGRIRKENKKKGRSKVRPSSGGRRGNNQKVVSLSVANSKNDDNYTRQYMKRDRSRSKRSRSSGRQKGNVHVKHVKGTKDNDEYRRGKNAKRFAQNKKAPSSSGMSNKGFRLGMAKLIDKGYSKQSAYDSMIKLAKKGR